MNISRQALAVSALLAIIALTCFGCPEDGGEINTECFPLAIEYSNMVCECEDWVAYCECFTTGGFYDYLVEPHECLDVEVPDDCEDEEVSAGLLEDCECYTLGMSWNDETEQCEVYYLTCNSELVAELKDLIDNTEHIAVDDITVSGDSLQSAITEFTFESANGYSTEHPAEVSFGEFSVDDNVFGRNENDTNWDVEWGARTGDWFFGWRDPEGEDFETEEPFIFVSDPIDISGHTNVEVSIFWRAEGDFSAGTSTFKIHLVEDGVDQPSFFVASRSDLNTSSDWEEVTEVVSGDVDSIRIVIEGLNSGFDCPVTEWE